MSNLTRDTSQWQFLGNPDGTYRVASVGTRKVLAPSLTLDEAVQMVDEHLFALRLFPAREELERIMVDYQAGHAITDLDGRVYERAAL
jgi:hypothetical protein